MDGAEVAGGGGHAAGCGADEGLGDEGDYGGGVEATEFGVEFGGEALDVLGFGFVGVLVLVGVGGAYVGDVGEQERLVRHFAGEVAREGHGADCGAVIALFPGDEVSALGAAGLEEVLPC